ncbi:hypothetical protein ACWGDX_12735 [Streptomyces sp. NPDC055025]
MATYVIAALCNVHTDRERDFNEWYETKHIPELLGLPGFLSVKRLVLNDLQISTDASHSQDHFRHLALIEFDTDDLDTTLAAVRTLDGARAAEFLIPGQVMTSLYRAPIEQADQGAGRLRER